MRYFGWRCDKCKKLQLAYKTGNNATPFKCKLCGATKKYKRKTKYRLHYSVLAVYNDPNEARAWLDKEIWKEKNDK